MKTFVKDLFKAIEKHWQMEYTACPETCICWEIYSLALTEEQKRKEVPSNDT